MILLFSKQFLSKIFIRHEILLFIRHEIIVNKLNVVYDVQLFFHIFPRGNAKCIFCIFVSCSINFNINVYNSFNTVIQF